MQRKGYYSLGVLMAGCLAAGAVQAQNEQYAKIQAAVSDFNGYDNGISLVGTYGFKLPQVHRNFSIEAEATKSIINPEFGILEASYYSVGAYAVYTHPINQTVELYGRGGLLYLHTSRDYYTNWWFSNNRVTVTDNDIEPTIGVGTNIAFTDSLDFTAGATLISDDIAHLGAGFQFKF